jgi:RimJ/RimL family protein N-acetyltransferase
MLELESLKPEQLWQVYMWDEGERYESFESYERRLMQPNWMHYALTNGGFIGCISLELTGPTTCSIHVAKQPGAGTLADLRRVIFSVADYLFEGGMQSLLAEVRIGNRPARRLALACGMFTGNATDTHQYYTLTKEQYDQSWMRESLYGKAKAASNAV